MSQLNGTGVTYPTIELGGVTYELKVTREAAIYRVGKNGLNFSDLNEQAKRPVAVADFMHVMMDPRFQGSAEDVFTLIMKEGKIGEATAAVFTALGKVFPSPIKTAAAVAGDQPSNLTQ
jgi:hypothetical protein